MLSAALIFLSALSTLSNAQVISGVDVSPDAVWHNRYHAILSMAAYNPNYDTLCPQQTFTQAGLGQSFPQSTSQPWEVIERFGPTEHGAEGFTVIIPEMDKVVVVFQGNYGIENHLNESSVNLDQALGLGTCGNCTGNAQAVTAYVEAREATNNWAIAAAAVERTGHQWSLAGHGFGGMLSIIGSIDLGWAGRVRWSHNYGAPLTVNGPAAALYQSLFQGEAGETGIANGDPIPYKIAESANYTRTPTLFYYFGYNATTHMNMNVCGSTSDPLCQAPQPYNETDRYFYFTPVGQCGGNIDRQNITAQNQFIASQSSAFYATASVSATGIQSFAASSAVPTQSAIPSDSAALVSASVSGNAQAAVQSSTSSASSICMQLGTLASSLAIVVAFFI